MNIGTLTINLQYSVIAITNQFLSHATQSKVNYNLTCIKLIRLFGCVCVIDTLLCQKSRLLLLDASVKLLEIYDLIYRFWVPSDQQIHYFLQFFCFSNRNRCWLSLLFLYDKILLLLLLYDKAINRNVSPSR